MFSKKKELKFTYDWVSDFIPMWEKQFAPFKGKKDLHYLEVGVFEGRSLIWMFENILTHKSCRATVVDFFYHNTEQTFYDNMKATGLNKRIRVRKGTSPEVLRTLKPNSYDIIFVDGDHRARGAFLDLAYAWPLLKEGGVLVFDDIKIHTGINPPEANVEVVADMFLTSFQNEFDLMEKNYRQFFVKKKPLADHGYITCSGNFFLSWGNHPSLRKVVDTRNYQTIPLAHQEMETLASCLHRRPLGVLKASLESCDPAISKSLLSKVPDFFQEADQL